MLTGITRPGAIAETLPADVLRLARLTMPATRHVVRLGAYLDGGGASSGTQRVRAVIFAAAGALIQSGIEVVFDEDLAAGWQTFRFDPPGRELEAGDYYVGLHAGATGDVLRVYRDAAGANRYTAADTYADGAPDPAPALAAAAGALSVFLETIGGYVVPAAPDLYLAQLPFPLAQRVLGATGPLPRSARQARCGWHGVTVDPIEGATAIVRTGGPLEDLVGERIRVTRRRGPVTSVVFAYVIDDQAWPDDVDDEDFSLQRRPFLELAGWGEGVVDVTVEPLSGSSDA